ncbi:MAG TPA: hypothetical protein VFL41_08720 [Gaiellaceae bacterium]|nr:hypothetical protein [Gaiellaceae bacterium]
MKGKSSRRLRTYAIAVLVLLGALVIPVAATAAVETFHRFEAVATANYTVTQTCPDGSTVQTLVTVIGGHEEEQEDGVTTLDHDFLTVLFRGRDCAGFLSDRGSTNAAEFSHSPSLQTASVAGTVTTNGGRTVTVDIAWEGTGPLEVTSNTTTFQGFTGHFVGRERDAVATGTVVVNGQTLVNGSTTNARIETLEDTNIRH